jgi:hypothetical protein
MRKMLHNLSRWLRPTDTSVRAESCVVVVNEIGGFAYEVNRDVATPDRVTTEESTKSSPDSSAMGAEA